LDALGDNAAPSGVVQRAGGRETLAERVGFVNSVVPDFQGILSRWSPALSAPLTIAVDKGERFERARVSVYR
jgi:hypothetical protein